MTLDQAAERLAAIARKPIRGYSNYDFGRAQDAGNRSVVVAKGSGRRIVEAIRRELGPGLIAFIGTTQWLGDEEQGDAEEVVVAPGKSQFDILRIARSDAVNYDMLTDELIAKLSDYDKQFGIDIFHAETDTIEFRFARLPENLPKFCKDLYEFCPDIVDQGVGSVERLEQEIRRKREVFLWWD